MSTDKTGGDEVSDKGSLHNRIMNIPANNSHSQSYKMGHRDARHAAAEMMETNHE